MQVHYSSKSSEHLTPPHIVRMVFDVLGGIDLDPSADETKTIPAVIHYTITEDGLTHPWMRKVYMNPPYGRDIPLWVSKLVGEYEFGNCSEAIALLPARVDTKWWGSLSDYPTCFIRGRLHFSGSPNAAPFPSAVVYLGQNMELFSTVFSSVGLIYKRVR